MLVVTDRPRDRQTLSPIELFWTAKNYKEATLEYDDCYEDSEKTTLEMIIVVKGMKYEV